MGDTIALEANRTNLHRVQDAPGGFVLQEDYACLTDIRRVTTKKHEIRYDSQFSRVLTPLQSMYLGCS